MVPGRVYHRCMENNKSHLSVHFISKLAGANIIIQPRRNNGTFMSPLKYAPVSMASTMHTTYNGNVISKVKIR
jgi:hypothetical protein